MDTPDSAASLADAKVADAVNREWLLASACSSQLSTDLRAYQFHWSNESGHLRSQEPGRRLYGAVECPISGPSSGRQSFSAPSGSTGWRFWRRRRDSATCMSNTYAVNGHLYDNISYADTPLLRSLTRKSAEPPLAADADFCRGRFRILLACLVLLGITLANYSRNALSLAAVGMVASNALNRELVELLAQEPASSLRANLSGQLDGGSCPIGARLPLVAVSSDRALQLETDRQRAMLELQLRASIGRRVASGELVDWTPGQLGLISAAGSVGNLLIAIPLTRLGEIYGPKWVIFVASLGATLQAALMPVLARCAVPLVLLFQLVFNGLTYGADCVAYTLFAHWLTPTEMAFFVSCLVICYQLGAMISSFVTAHILAQGLAWAWCFYAPAILCAAWTLVWSLVGASEPRLSPFVSQRELAHLNKQSKIALTLVDSPHKTTTGAHPVAWSKLARDPNIWAIIAVKFTLRWYFSAYLSLMPTFLSSVAHMSVATIGRMSVAQSLVGLLAGVLMGYLTRSLVSQRLCGLSIATSRKCFQSVVNFGLALSLLVFIAYDCNQWLTIVALTLGTFCVSFYVAAALQIPLDLSANHCGLITSVTNTLALGQALGAPISGLILNAGPKERVRWRLVWGLAVAMNILSGLVFILLVDSKPRDYNKYQDEEDATAATAASSRPAST